MPVSRRDFVALIGSTALLPAHNASVRAAGRGITPPASPIRLDSNENPYGPSVAARTAIRDAMTLTGRYPDAQALVAAIAKANGVAEGNVLLTVGATEGLAICARGFTTPERPLVTGAPSYGAIASATEALGHQVSRVPVTSAGDLDLDAMLDRARGAGILYLCNPNNPTGTVIPASTLQDAIARLEQTSPETIVVVGEAYHEYVESPDYASAANEAIRNPRVIVNRTFSKLYALAGLRLGYLIGHRETLKRISGFRVSIGASVPGIAAGLAVVADQREVLRQRQLNTAGRKKTEQYFTRHRVSYYPAHANYLFLKIDRDVTTFREACQAKGLLIGRRYPPADQFARLTIGTPDEMRRALPIFLAALYPS